MLRVGTPKGDIRVNITCNHNHLTIKYYNYVFYKTSKLKVFFDGAKLLLEVYAWPKLKIFRLYLELETINKYMKSNLSKRPEKNYSQDSECF